MKNRNKFDADVVENSKMAARGLKEALGMHFEATWEALAGVDGELGDLTGALGPPRKEINLLIREI